MVPNILPNWARLALTIATALSYLPQYHRVREQGHCDGLSLYYVLFGLLNATEQFAIGFFLNVNDTGFPRPDVFVNNPATAGDWFNFGQLATVWLCSLLLFIISLRYSARNSQRRAPRGAVSAICVCFSLLTLFPVILDALQPPTRSEPRRWAQEIVGLIHYLGILPASTILAVAGVVPQVREMRSRTDARALSLPGLAVQAVVFSLVAISWMVRVKYPPYLPSWVEWYWLIGWPVVNNGLFAFAQGVLLWIVLRRPGDHELPDDDERSPLLSS